MSILWVSLVLLVPFASARTQWHELDNYSFEDYLSEFGKSYGTAEHTRRAKLFATALSEIRTHNNAGKSWKEGVNRFTDWTALETKSLLGYDKRLRHTVKTGLDAPAHLFGAVEADSVDWRTHEPAVVTPVKDQGGCGSCWSFATAETIESQWALKTGKLETLSEQQILSCPHNSNPKHCGGTGGCNGGIAELGFESVRLNGGIASEWQYPYTSYFGSGSECALSGGHSISFVANVSGHTTLPENQYEPLLNAVAKIGPIAISVAAMSWGRYESGVFDGCNQTHPDIDHAVQLVGYGTDAKLGDYYLVRNSWSPDWGEEGYIRVKRTAAEQQRCGMDLKPQDGFGCDDGPSQIKVCGTCAILSDSSYPMV